MKPGSMLCLEVGIPGLSGFPDRKAEGCIRRPLSVQKAASSTRHSSGCSRCPDCAADCSLSVALVAVLCRVSLSLLLSMRFHRVAY